MVLGSRNKIKNTFGNNLPISNQIKKNETREKQKFRKIDKIINKQNVILYFRVDI